MPTTRIPWVRSWPNREAHYLPMMGRRFVWDPFTPRVEMDHDYRPLLAGLDASTVIVEWDIAFGADDAALFERYCLEDPNIVHVAPYYVYPASTALRDKVWVHRIAKGQTPYRWTTRDDSSCDLFGFGMVYLPLQTIRDYLSETDEITTDATFSLWHYNTGRGSVPIHWDVRVIHLHY